MTSFADPRRGLWLTPSKLASSLGVTEKEAKTKLRESSTAEIEQKVPKINAKDYIPITGPPGSYQMDILFMPRAFGSDGIYNALLTIISIGSRLADAEPLTSKTDGEVSLALRVLLGRHKDVRSLTTDNGGEFRGRQFESVLEREHIMHNMVPAGEHTALGIVDRFHRTLRSLFRRYALAGGRKSWLDVYEDLLYNYNNSPHRSIGKPPAEFNEERDLVGYLHTLDDRATPQKYADGEHVRVKVLKTMFGKETPSWSEEVYTVAGVEGNRVLVRASSGAVRREPPRNLKRSLFETEKPTTKPGQNYVPDRITEHRITDAGKVQYKVRWEGFTEETWEPPTNLRLMRRNTLSRIERAYFATIPIEARRAILEHI